jgi:hypothetical protein
MAEVAKKVLANRINASYTKHVVALMDGAHPGA